MNLRILSSGALSALAGAAMLAVSAEPSPAFTLYSPSLEGPVAAADIQPVYYPYYHRPYYGYRYGYRYRPYYGYGYRPYGYGYRPYGYVYPRYRHCWIGAYGVRHCY